MMKPAVLLITLFLLIFGMETALAEGPAGALPLMEDGSTEFPDSPAGKCAEAYIQAFNSGSDSLMESFLRKYKSKESVQKRPMEERIRQYHEILDDMGKLILIEVLQSSESSTTLLIGDSKTRQQWEFFFQLEKDSPQFLESISISGPVYAQANCGGPRENTSNASALNSELRGKIVAKISEAMNDYYVFPDVAKNIEGLLRKKHDDGRYDRFDSLETFARQLQSDMFSIAHDYHISVVAGIDKEHEEEDELNSEEARKRLARWKFDNFGFYKVERLAGNVGYLDLRRFSDPRSAGPTAVAAMNFLANSDALIIDLRKNPGGTPWMVQLIASYFFDEPKHLNSFYERADDFTKQFWSFPHVCGPRMADVPVYVLVSNFTASGAEEFAYNLKNLERATIIGKTTCGAAHPTEFHQFPELGVTVGVPFGRAVNPITKTNWEGKGVEPHISVPIDEALVVGHMEAIKKLLAGEQDVEKKRIFRWVLKSLEAERSPLALSEAERNEYAGYYGHARVWLEEENLFTQPPRQPKRKLVPLGNDLFALEGVSERLQFDRDDKGKIATLTVVFEDGRRMSLPRSGE